MQFISKQQEAAHTPSSTDLGYFTSRKYWIKRPSMAGSLAYNFLEYHCHLLRTWIARSAAPFHNSMMMAQVYIFDPYFSRLGAAFCFCSRCSELKCPTSRSQLSGKSETNRRCSLSRHSTTKRRRQRVDPARSRWRKAIKDFRNTLIIGVVSVVVFVFCLFAMFSHSFVGLPVGRSLSAGTS